MSNLDEAWEGERLLSIAGVGVRLRLGAPDLAEAVDTRTAVYQCHAQPPGTYDLTVAQGARGTVDDAMRQSFSRVTPTSFRLNREEHLAGALSLADRSGQVSLAANRFAVDSLLRLLLNLELPRVGGSLIHAAGVVWGDQALVFPGVSGAGKSTLAANVGGEPLLTDEMVAVRPVDGAWRAFGTPFHGDLEITPQAVDRPLRAIVFPDRSLPTGMAPLSRGAAAGRLMETLVNYGDDPATDRLLLDVAVELATDVPCFTLSYRKTDPVRPLIQAGLDP